MIACMICIATSGKRSSEATVLNTGMVHEVSKDYSESCYVRSSPRSSDCYT